ncbi:MAG: phenylacetate--CoA ligase, partial [Planctomycetes bacterium]|nr:phenylacetate--CoA ligase [Planctomycetota bacterium]
MPTAADRSHCQFHPASASDYLPPPQLRDLQLSRLKASLARAYHCQESGFLRQRMAEKNLTLEDIATLDDIRRLPFSLKTDLRDTYPFGLFAVPRREVVRI